MRRKFLFCLAAFVALVPALVLAFGSEDSDATTLTTYPIRALENEAAEDRASFNELSEVSERIVAHEHSVQVARYTEAIERALADKAYVEAALEAEQEAAQRAQEARERAARPSAPQTAPQSQAAPSPAPSGDCRGWGSLIASYFGSSAARACQIMECESQGNPNAVSRTNDHGLFQINRPSHEDNFKPVTGKSWSSVYEPDANVKYAHWLWTQQGWSPWACA